MSTDIAVQENPGTLMTRATDVAGVCAEIVKRTAQQIQGRKYVRVEGWQSIAAAYGCVASSKNVQKVDGGVRATGELHRISDGALIASAEGFVGEDEPTWYGGTVVSYGKEKTLPKRPDYAIMAMAQTRAISRVCRSAFAFVVVMIDGNLSTTPAEEMGYEPREEKTVEAAPVDRTKELTDLCAKAKMSIAEVLAKAEVAHPDEMSDADYDSAVAMLKRIAIKNAKAAKEAA